MILAYLFIILIIGLYKSKNKNDDYIFDSRRLTLPAFIATFVTTWYGGILEIGRFTFQNGIITWIIFGLFYYISAFLLLKFIAPKIHKNNIETIPNYIHKNYGYISGLMSSIIISLITSPAPYLIIFATIFNHIYNLNYLITISIGMFFSVFYIILGGFKSIIRTDKFQFILMYLGFILLLINLYTTYGGLSFLIENSPKDHFNLNNKLPISYIISWFFISMITFIDPNIFHRIYSAKNEKILKKGIFLSILLWIIFDFLTITAGLYASAIIKEVNITHSPYLILSAITLSPLMRDFFIISLLSVVMSTIDSFTFTSAVTIGKELKNNKSSEYNTKIGLILTSIITLALCMFFERVIDIWYIFGSLGVSTLLVPLIFSILKINRENHNNAKIIVIPLIVFIIWNYFDNPFLIDSIYVGLFTSLFLNYFFLVKRVDNN